MIIMKGLASGIKRGVIVGTKVKVDDNSGAKMIRVIGRQGYRGRRGRLAHAGVADIVFGSVIVGKPDLKGKVVRAVIIRQATEFRRPNGLRIKFEDNACVLITDKNEPKGSEIKGVVALEISQRFPKVATKARNIV